MTDYFALLGEARRPWLDNERLKAKFLARTSEVHPDRVHGSSAEEKQRAQDRYTELNTAYQSLRETRSRLAHLLELELGIKPQAIQTAPQEVMDAFLEVGTLCREADKLLGEKSSITSPLLQVGWFEKSQEISERIMALQQNINAQLLDIDERLRELNGRWDAGDTQQHLAELEPIYRSASYLSRWAAQLQERIVQLAL